MDYYEQHKEKQTIWFKLKRFFNECKRVLVITKKPDAQEFKTIVKISGLGLLIIGLIGFVIQIISQVFF